MAKVGENFQVAPRSAAEIENRERRVAFDVLQQRGDILAHIMAARALPEIVSTLVVVVQRICRDLFQILGIEFHIKNTNNGAAFGTFIV